MFQLHLSQFLLATTGVVAAFVSLPSPLLDSRHDAIIQPLSKQSFHQDPGFKSEQKITEGPAPWQNKTIPAETVIHLGMPHHLTQLKSDEKELSEQYSEVLFVSLLPQEPNPQGKIEQLPSIIASAQLEPAPKEETVEQNKPTIGNASRVVVPSIGIDIAVRTGLYDSASGSWQVDDGSAFYAGTTVPVNDSNGTTLIYGHAKWGIFGTLPDIQPGAEVTVYTTEGMRFVYIFESIKQADPSDVSLLTIKGKPKLLLQTCSGFFDQHRTLALFALKEVIPSTS